MLSRITPPRYPRWWGWLVLLIFLTPAMLACGFLGGQSSSQAIFQTRLPTLTATRLPTLTPTVMSTPVAIAAELEVTVSSSPSATPMAEPTVSNTQNVASNEAANSMTASASSADSTNSSAPNDAEVQANPNVENNAVSPSTINTPTAIATVVPTETALPTDVPTPTPTATPLPAEWIFTPAQVYTDQYEDGLLLYGEVLNNTGLTQQIGYISGTFYNAQGQIIADENSTGDYWPFKLIPPGERLPFGLFVDGIDSAANFDLQVQAEPGSETQRYDFQFLNLNQWVDEIGEYCVAGELRNPGGELQEYVLMMAILYDSQEKVINFGDELEPRPGILGDKTLDFEICTQTLGQAVARHELRAWGE